MAIRAVVFDKDGTLFDFHATWGAFGAALLDRLAAGDAGLRDRLADRLGYADAAARFRADSIVVAHTADEVMAHAAPLLPGHDVGTLIETFNAMAAVVTPVPAADLRTVLTDLRARGLALGVMTNDAAAAAAAQLVAADIADLFDVVLGYDSGHGAKPAAAPLLACAAAMGVHPADCVMVGDSAHDLVAGRAAGMACVGVLSGPATRDGLAPLADAVLASVADLPGWLDAI